MVYVVMAYKAMACVVMALCSYDPMWLWPYIFMACVVTAYIVMAYVVVALCTYGLYSHGLSSSNRKRQQFAM